ncbi:hypothetical protein DN752_10230 [Echinicola strongylocentroti]|uniref:Uncharacterized protein n=1 Tax=Echinicola strongylocentroti TaxID=1795355 RepID=A0A2Z4IIB1_9BACT|nr:hypothetical protein DN752_10230 [Echinicola strongylocentroti]
MKSLDVFLDRFQLLDNRLKHEAIGRIGFYLRKFEHDLELMGGLSVFTEAGWAFFHEFRSCFLCSKNKRGEETEKFIYTNQPYVFQYDQFSQKNPLR